MSQRVDELPVMPTTDSVGNPFPGLRPFKIEESHLFFGREGQSDEVLLKLSRNRFVGVIGPSGSGKSSFIYCGVMPILYGGFLTNASPDWEVVVTRPGGGPIDNLAEALLTTTADYASSDAEDRKIKRTIVSTLLRSSSLGLVEAIEQSRRSEDVNYLILVDQFEELFRFKDGKDPNAVNETLAFVNLLMEAIHYTDAPIYIAITMRSDFIGDCAQFPELTRMINDSHYLIPQMTRDQKRGAIEGPVAVGDATIAPRLVQQLLNDLGDNPDQLPILQHALMRTWNYWTYYRDSAVEPLDLKHYEAIGTMTEALSQHANEAYDELEDEQKRVCEILFKAITEKRGESFGIRRPTRLNEIAAIADVTEEEVSAVIEKFRAPGRSLLTPAFGIPLEGKSMIDISHESLMRIWVRLKNWVEDESEAVQMYLRLAEAATQYQVGKAGLWRPPDLQLALNWQSKHRPTLVWGRRYHPAFERTMIFLEYSKKDFDTEQRIKEIEAKRRLRYARIIALILGGFLIVALVAFVYAFQQQTEAKKQTKLANDNLIVADNARKEAEKQTQIAKDAASFADKQKLIALEQEAIAKDQTKIAENQKKLADLSAAEALLQEQRATDSAKAANIQRKRAIQNAADARNAEKAAQRERYLSVARSIALKSKELKSDTTQEALLAQQAYNFFKTYDGYAYDNDIYNGLFEALKVFRDPITLSMTGHNRGAARALVTHKGNTNIYSGGSDGKIIKWVHQNGTWKSELLKEFKSGNSDPYYAIYSMDVSADGNWLVAGGLFNADRNSNYVYLIDLNDPGKSPKKITGYKGDIENIKFTPDSKGFYARANSGRSIMYSDLSTAKEVINSKEKITSIDLNADGTKLVGAGVEGNLYMWDTGNQYSVNTYNIIRSKDILAVSFMPDGRRVVVGDEVGIVRIVDTGVVVRQLSGHLSQIEQIKFNPTGKFMATASKDGSVRLWNLDDLKEQPIVLSDHTWVWSIAFTPDGQQLVAGLHNKEETAHGANEAIHAWPTQIPSMASLLCGYIKRNMTKNDWEQYMRELPYESTCSNLPPNNK